MMSAQHTPPQVSPADALRSVMTSSSKLAAAAAVCMLLFLFLPAANVSGSVMGFSSGGLSFSGSDMGGWTAWLCFLVFVAAAATRFVPSLLPYRRLVDIAAFAMVAVVLVYAVFASPIAAASQQVNQLGSLIGGDMGRGLGGNLARNRPAMPPPVSFSVLPHVGVLFFLLAPVLLFLAKRRERVLPTVVAGL